MLIGPSKSQIDASKRLNDIRNGLELEDDPLLELQRQLTEEQAKTLQIQERYGRMAEALISFAQVAGGGYSTGNTVDYILNKVWPN
ncbi:TPA: hypothetical protein EYO12_00835 [Candidatus Saccharibacteria bacterium]|nr:hypothetical protein [Candidatus Saccharibacteria bacterium]HIO87263.1 hypothetical protein [Candidatus Saccharibacteria bacterium]